MRLGDRRGTVGRMQLADLRIFTEPQQGATYDTLLAVAQRTEALGFGAFFRSDHYLKMGDVSGLPGPTDAWITLAGLARDTSTIRLGTLVSPVTFRSPGLLAISVAQVDQMSGGRVELGLGAGWYEAEHTAYGFDFPSTGARFDSLTDQLAIIDGMWSTPIGETFSYAGTAHSVVDSPGLPKPVQSAVADRDRWRRQDQDTGARRALRRRVQPAVRAARRVRRAVRSRARGVRRHRAHAPDGVLGRAHRVRRARRGRGGAACGGAGSRAGRAAPERRGRHARRGRRHHPRAGPRPAPSGCTCRCSTSTTSTTST